MARKVLLAGKSAPRHKRHKFDFWSMTCKRLPIPDLSSKLTIHLAKSNCRYNLLTHTKSFGDLNLDRDPLFEKP